MTDKTDNRFYREAGEREAWRAAFDERHEFDVYPDHFMTGMRNEFCAGWYAALKIQAASQPKSLTDDLLVQLFYAAQGNITQFRIKARALLEAK